MALRLGKQGVLAFLDAQNVHYELTEHQAVFSMSQSGDVTLPYPQDNAKNLFVRDDKKQHYYLITVRGDKRVDLKEFRHANGLRALSFASPDDLMERLGVVPGCVSPFGLLNNEARDVEWFLDRDFVEHGRMGIHPNDNTATVWISTDDMIAIAKAHGNVVCTVQIEQK